MGEREGDCGSWIRYSLLLRFVRRSGGDGAPQARSSAAVDRVHCRYRRGERFCEFLGCLGGSGQDVGGCCFGHLLAMNVLISLEIRAKIYPNSMSRQSSGIIKILVGHAL